MAALVEQPGGLGAAVRLLVSRLRVGGGGGRGRGAGPQLLDEVREVRGGAGDGRPLGLPDGGRKRGGRSVSISCLSF